MLDAVAPLRDYAQSASKRLLETLSHVPDDKLEWSPSPTAKSALRIAAHAGKSLGHFTSMMKGESPPDVPFDKLMEMMEADEREVKTREQAVSLIQSATADVVAGMEALAQEQFDSTVETPFSKMPMRFIVSLAGRHTESHAAQIDYLQSIWGDMGFYF